MGIFTYFIAIAIGIFAQKVRGRNGLAWGAGTLMAISLGHIYIQLAGGSEWVWTIVVSTAVVLLLVGLNHGKRGATETAACRISTNEK
ncbi:hypothetical protein VX159_07075 [Dechloromonas sp. ZY10]|uniref:hypothetical protein n=1 Tax=Dechloromonas aquae TaxID=2664436 RepID=UPI0035273961